MKKGQTVEEYQRRLKDIPKINRELEQEIRHLQNEVDQQENEVNTQNVKVKLLEEQMGRLDKTLETRQNQIQELTESEEKSAQKEKKYFMQIQNYNKKIENLKAEVAKTQKSIALMKKETKVLQSTIASSNSQKNKVLQQLTKGQLKMNGLTQTLNEFKARAMDKGASNSEDGPDPCKRQQKQINDLFAAIKKQMQMIDVLKKQKVHLMASTIFKYCEQDFSKLLDMKGQQ